MNATSSPRSHLLALLNGVRDETIPCFSGLSAITAPALAARGLTFSHIHTDAHQMVVAAASAHELYGFQTATLPTDMCVEAEALGASVDFRADVPEPMWPLVPHPLFASPADVIIPSGDFVRCGRIPLVLDALRNLKTRVGQTAVIGAWVPGPFTLAMYVADFDTLLMSVKHSPREVGRALDALTDLLIEVALAYAAAGAELLTIHEMGGSPGVLGPRAFGELVLPRLQRLTNALPAPRLLSVCGNTNNAMELLADAGADALNVEHTNDLARSRKIVGADMLLFGNLDPVGVIAHGDADRIRNAIVRAVDAGADAIMPGCDLFLQTPAANMRALVETSAKMRRLS